MLTQNATVQMQQLHHNRLMRQARLLSMDILLMTQVMIPGNTSGISTVMESTM